MTIINTTPHSITFRDSDGTEFDVSPSKWIINASVQEEVVTVRNGVEYVRTRFVPSAEGRAAIKEIRDQHSPDVIIVGSIIAAQAYPGQVVAMTPAPGYERVSVEQKRMNPHKFTTFGDLPPVATPQTDSAPAAELLAEAEKNPFCFFRS